MSTSDDKPWVRATGLAVKSDYYGDEIDEDDVREVLTRVEAVFASGRVLYFAAVDPYVTWWKLGSFDYRDVRDSVSDRILEMLIATKRLETLEGLELPDVPSWCLARLAPFGKIPLRVLRLGMKASDEEKAAFAASPLGRQVDVQYV